MFIVIMSQSAHLAHVGTEFPNGMRQRIARAHQALKRRWNVQMVRRSRASSLRVVRRIALLGGVLISAMMLPCATHAAGGSPAAVQAVAHGVPAYRVLPGDALDISVWGESTLQLKGVRVLPDGSISFPLAGRIEVAGMTTSAIETELARRLSPYLKTPQVSVMVSDTAGSLVYVLGKVDKPGPVPLTRPMTVLQVLSVTGAFDKFADTSNIRVLHMTPSGQQVITVNYDAMVKGRDLSDNVQVQPGDTILVP